MDPKTWSGSLPNQWGTAPMVRVGRSRWFNLLWLVPLGLAFLVVGVAAAQALRELPSVQAFVEQYPGTIPPPNDQEGIPAWVGWQHFLNLFLMTFIIRSAVQILADHHRLYWTRHSTPGREWFRFQKEVPADPLWTAKQDSVNVPGWIGIPGLRHSIGLARWWHLAHPIEHMRHHLTMLAYDMNGAPLSYGHGAPLRLRNESEHGFKQVKWIGGIEFIRHFSEIGGGRGGYNQDHEFFGYRHAI